MQIIETLQAVIAQALSELGFEHEGTIHLEHPSDLAHGDFSSNIAMVLAKEAGKNPRELAEEIVKALRQAQGDFASLVSEIKIAGPGFINFYLSKDFYEKSLIDILEKESDFGNNKTLEGQKVMVEYTDPNPFKVFHIGHLMSNAIGESIARLYESAGAHVVRANYQGDVGLHVAKAIWGMMQNKDALPTEEAPLSERTAFLGEVYVAGAKAYKEDEDVKKEIDELNRTIFEGHNADVQHLYEQGRAWSLAHFEELYEKLGTKFDQYFFESEVAADGSRIVEEQLDKGVFKESNGAIIFDGEPYGLHARVFMNSLGLPTYEAKEIGLNYHKQKREPHLDQSVVITAEEQKEYMRVVLKAIEQFWPEVVHHTHHLTHGMMRFAGGKMSSREGNVITGESLLSDMEQLAIEKIQEGGRAIAKPEKLATNIAVAGIKYSVLRQGISKNIIFDPEQSLSFEGDSGPYLQYTFARTQSILRKAISHKPSAISLKKEITDLERLLCRFPEQVDVALSTYAPHHIANYLIEIAREFNSFYGNTKILDADNPETPHNLAITQAVGIVLKNGLWVLGIEAPNEM